MRHLTRMDSTERYLGIEVEDALEISKGVEM
ncbi:MAG: integrase [Paracoccaceae bacterium]